MSGRLLLRPWAASDAGPLIESFRDPELVRWTAFHVPDAAAAAAWLAVQREGWAAGTRFSLVVEEMGDDGTPLLVGNVALKAARFPDGVGEVGFWTAPWARGRGVAPAAVIALSSWAFETFPLTHLELRHHLANTASCRVALRAGFDEFSEHREGDETGHVHVLKQGSRA